MIRKLLVLLPILTALSCSRDAKLAANLPYQTKYVFIVVMDGARYSETFGDPKHEFIPGLNYLAKQGVMANSFWNAGVTATVPGHTAITTGNYQVINNAGQEIPKYPSIFQYYLRKFNKPSYDAWIFASKDKLEVLSDCTDSAWAGKFRPRTDCGINGNFTGYREDSVTLQHVIDTSVKYHPHLVLVNFKEPDAAGHSNNWPNYIQKIRITDDYIVKLWQFIQNDPVYANNTTMIVTNDHGRHTDDIPGGFSGHGDNCKGCMHIMMVAAGPDFKVNYIEEEYYTMADIPATVAGLLKFDLPTGTGKNMHTIFR